MGWIQVYLGRATLCRPNPTANFVSVAGGFMINTKFMSHWKSNVKLTPVQLIVVSYFVATFIAMFLLSLPISLKDDVQLSFVDILFTAVSAIWVTGLTVVNTADIFTVFGISMLMLVLQFGAIGLMTLGTFIYLISGSKVGLKHRQLIMIDQNRHSLHGMVRTVIFL